MPELLTLFGAALLEVQDAVARNVKVERTHAVAPNLIFLRLDRNRFVQEHPGEESEEVDRFRRRIAGELSEYIAANEWQTDAASNFIISISLGDLKDDVAALAEHRDWLVKLKVRDDEGERIVPVSAAAAVIGRMSDATMPNLVTVHDGSRTVSREHLLLQVAGERLLATVQGKNETLLNGESIQEGETVELHQGDSFSVGPHSIDVTELNITPGEEWQNS